MTVVCPECGSVNKKGNKFCFECGMKLPSEGSSTGQAPPMRSSIDEKHKHLKGKWLRGEISAEEYRGHLLRLKLKERFGSHMLPKEDEKKDDQDTD